MSMRGAMRAVEPVYRQPMHKRYAGRQNGNLAVQWPSGLGQPYGGLKLVTPPEQMGGLCSVPDFPCEKTLTVLEIDLRESLIHLAAALGSQQP